MSVDSIDSLDDYISLKSQPEEQDVPKSFSDYLTFENCKSLVLLPFVQGLFYGLGEGAARALISHYWGYSFYSTSPIIPGRVQMANISVEPTRVLLDLKNQEEDGLKSIAKSRSNNIEATYHF